MELNRHASDEKSSFAYNPCDSYYASEALHSGFLGRAAVHSLPPHLSEREAIARKILKEKIREEILAKEMTERKILEEEVRREIEMERILQIKRFPMERLSALRGNTDVLIPGDGCTRSFVLPGPHGRSGASLRQELEYDAAEFAFRDRSPSHLLQKKPPVYAAQSSLQHNLEKHSPLEETITSNCKSSGAKRKKAGREFSPPAEKQWGCALCEVSATSETALKEHLRGKRHKSKVALLASKTLLQSNSTSGNKKKQLVKGSSAGGPGKEQHLRFWCGICTAKCNSKKMLERHFNGKKHKSFMELKKDDKGVETEAGKEGGNGKGFEKEAVTEGGNDKGFEKVVMDGGNEEQWEKLFEKEAFMELEKDDKGFEKEAVMDRGNEEQCEN